MIHWAHDVGHDWEEIAAELKRAFLAAREAAQAGRSWVFVVHQDALLGRRGVGNAMVAAGLLSAARTAALEGVRTGWRANVVAHDEGVPRDLVSQWAERLLDHDGVTGELVRIGPGHLGKALP